MRCRPEIPTTEFAAALAVIQLVLQEAAQGFHTKIREHPPPSFQYQCRVKVTNVNSINAVRLAKCVEIKIQQFTHEERRALGHRALSREGYTRLMPDTSKPAITCFSGSAKSVVTAAASCSTPFLLFSAARLIFWLSHRATLRDYRCISPQP